MLNWPWRTIGGPLLTVLFSVFASYIDTYLIRTGAPGALPFMAVIYTAFVGGLVPALVSTLLAVTFSAIHNSLPGQLFTYELQGAFRVVFLGFFSLSFTVMICMMRGQAARLLETERASRARVETVNTELMRLHAALDRVDYGIVLLDEDLKAQFMNRAYLRQFDLPADQIKPGISFADLLRYVRETALTTLPRSEVEAYISKRVVQMRAGQENRADLRLISGKVVRAQSTPLPEGGWMLTYTDVTDLVSQADEMAQLAAIDSMTDLYNRRHFQKLGQEACERAQRDRKPLSLLMIDIDLFKNVNDRFGHAAGDEVIRNLADMCRAEMRPSDIGARLGGDEFALLLQDTPLEAALSLAERLRRRAASTAAVDGEVASVATISIGVAESTTGIRTLGDLMLRADTALYEAKRGNRNTVVCAAEHHQDIVAA